MMLDVFWFLDSFKFQWPVAVRAPGTCGRSNALAPWLPRFYMSPMESYLWCISTQIPVGLYILGGYSLKFRPYIGFIYGRYLQFRFLKWPLMIRVNYSFGMFWFANRHITSYYFFGGETPVSCWSTSRVSFLKVSVRSISWPTPSNMPMTPNS